MSEEYKNDVSEQGTREGLGSRSIMVLRDIETSEKRNSHECIHVWTKKKKKFRTITPHKIIM